MTTIRKTLTLPAAEIAEMTAFLAAPTNDDAHRTYTVDFGDGYEGDVKVCGCLEDPGFVDVVLFLDGQEVYSPREVYEGLEGTHVLRHAGREFVLEIKEGTT